MSQLNTKSSFKTLLNLARREVLINKNPESAIKLLLELPESNNEYDNNLYKNTLALAFFENKNYTEAARIYRELDEKYQAGFCELLQGNVDLAEQLWNEAPKSEASEWGISLIDLLNQKLHNLPTFIQIRNHLECDLGYFIQANRFEYAEDLIQYAEILASVNLEAYKFIGKALLNNGFADLSVNYFLKSQKLIPQDAEIYYHLGYYGYQAGAYEESRQMLHQCLALNKYYVPAVNLLKKLNCQDI